MGIRSLEFMYCLRIDGWNLVVPLKKKEPFKILKLILRFRQCFTDVDDAVELDCAVAIH
jgi:hypothetical protein